VLDYGFLDTGKERHEQRIREAESFRRALRSKRIRSSSILKSLVAFLLAVA
jgi:hypothetical protein